MELAIAFWVIAGLGVLLVLLVAHYQAKIRRLERNNKSLKFEKNLMSQEMRMANIKGVPPVELDNEDLE